MIALEVVLRKALNQSIVNIVMEEVKLERAKVFLRFNKLVHSVADMVRQLGNLAGTVMEMGKTKKMKI